MNTEIKSHRSEFLWKPYLSVAQIPAIPEYTLHSYAAVNAMLALTVLHALLCSSLLSLSTHERRIAREATRTRSASLKKVSVIDFDFRGAISRKLCMFMSQQMRAQIHTFAGVSSSALSTTMLYSTGFTSSVL